MSIVAVSKKKRLVVGVSAITIIVILFTVGLFIQKPRYYGPKLISVDIYKDSSLDSLPLYEALPNEDCVNVVNEQILTDEQKKGPKPQDPLDAPVLYASAPKCSVASAAPENYKKLEKNEFVVLTLNINKEGKIEYGEVEKTSGIPELDEAALKQVTTTWSFQPCTKADVIVACKQKIKFRWKTE